MSKELNLYSNIARVGNYSGIYFFDADGIHLENQIRLCSDYIEINPDNKTYEYDVLLSNSAGNYLYVGWELFDINKTNTENDSCVYCAHIKPTTNLIWWRYKGVVDLSKDALGNKTAFIRLRILNKWTDSDSNTSGIATVHTISLREVSTANPDQQQHILKNGQLQTDFFRETSRANAGFNKNGFVDGGQFYEY